MATVQVTIPDSLVSELNSVAVIQGYADLQALLKATVRSLLLRERVDKNASTLSAQVAQELP